MTDTQEFHDDHDDHDATAAGTGRRNWRSRRVLIPAVAVLAVLGIGGAVWANAGGDELAGNQRDKVSQAAIEAVGGGTVTEAEEDDGHYEVEVTRKDGTEVDLHLDKDYNVISSKADDDGDDDGYDGRDADDEPLTAAESKAAKKAALAELGGGTVTDVEREDHGRELGFEVEVTKADGTEWNVRLDQDYVVLDTDRDD